MTISAGAINWPKKYLEEIRADNIAVGHKVRVVYEREVGWMENPPENFPFYFDDEAGQRPIDFIERFCRGTKGRWIGKPLRLDLFQKAKIQLAFGWKEKETGFRRFREVGDIRGRKCGKTTESAGIALYMLTADGEGGAEIYCTANKKDQSDIIYTESANMRVQSPALRARTKKTQKGIEFGKTMSVMKSLAADTKTMDGFNTHFFVLDEWHEARTSKVYDVMRQSQSARLQPMAWLISTNGYVREAFFDDQYDYYSHVALWDEGFEDFRTLPLIYELDNRSEWDKPECWEKANPGIGKIKSLSILKDNVDRAKRDPKTLPTVLTKDFNIPENNAKAWLPYDHANNTTKFEMDFVAKSYAIGGCDLSATTDLTCATLLIRKQGDENYYVLQKYFLPESRVNAVEASNVREAPYALWGKQGYLEICAGATVDYHAVTRWFADMVEKYDIRPLWIAYDAALSGYWREEMEDYGFDMERIRQGPFTWTYPMKRLAGLFEEHRIVYNNNPMLKMCLLNTGEKTLNKDGIESIQPVKPSKQKRIDGMVSLLNAFVGYCNHEEEYMRYIR